MHESETLTLGYGAGTAPGQPHSSAINGGAENDEFRRAFEHAAFGMALVARSGRLLRVNPAMTRIFGYTEEELLEKTLRELAFTDDAHIGAELFHDLVNGQRTYGWLEKRYQHKDGSVIWLQLSTSVVRNAEGNLLYLVAQLQDITERVAAQELLEKRVAARTRELAALYDVTAVASASLDLETVMERSLDRVLNVMECDVVTLHLLDDATEFLELAAARSRGPGVLSERDQRVSALLAQEVITRQAPILVPPTRPSASAEVRFSTEGFDTSQIAAPMRAQGRVLGVLAGIGQEGRHFKAEEVALLASIADQIGVAVENARLYAQAERLAVMEERQRIARELHDAVAQSLYSATLIAEIGRRAAEAGDLPAVGGHLRRLGEITNDALKEMRLLLHELRPQDLEQGGLVAALRRRLQAVENRAGVKARLIVEGQPHLTPEKEEALYRIAQEALNNALRHADARTVTVEIGAGEEVVRLSVHDDGRGFDMAAAEIDGGMGLLNMQERAAQADARLEVTSSPGEGTRIEILMSQDGHRGADEASVGEERDFLPEDDGGAT